MGSDRVSGASSLPTHPNRVILRVSDWEARGGGPARAVTEKGQGLPHHLDSRGANEPQGPRARPGLDPGWCVWKSRAGRETTGKKEKGRQDCDPVNWHEGWESELLGWFPG